jgi:hypothetical protein
MTKEPLALKAVIANRADAIKISGGEGELAKLLLEVYLDDLDDFKRLVELRGRELRVVFVEET